MQLVDEFGINYKFMKNQKANLRIGLLDNSSHSLQRGYEMWNQWNKQEDPWSLKESIIWVHHGIELALKQLLVQTNEFLVFQDVDKAVERLEILRKKQGMENAGVLDLFEHDGRAISVGFGKLINRAAMTLSINELAGNSELRRKIDQLTKYRNNIVHFSIELDVVGVSSLLSGILNPFLDLLSTHVKDDNFQRIDIPKIRRLAQPVQNYVQYLRDQIVEEAIKATSEAIPPKGNGRAGIVSQVAGSGLDLSLLSYVKKVKADKQLRHKRVVIITDRVDIVNQLRRSFIEDAHLEPLVPETGEELNRILKKSSSELIISTIQKVGFEQYENSNRFLFIAYNLSSNSTTERLLSTFQGSTFILFSSSPPGLESGLFGLIIGLITFQDSIKYEINSPVTIENNHIQTEILPGIQDFELEDEVGTRLYPEITSLQYLEKLAESIIQHFESRQSKWLGKGVVVVNDISTAHRLSDMLSRGWSKRHEINHSVDYVQALSSMVSDQERNFVLQRFRDQENTLSLLVCTGAFLGGYDNPLIHTIYVTSSVSQELRYKLASLVSRRIEGKDNGLIVDYVGLHWELE